MNDTKMLFWSHCLKYYYYNKTLFLMCILTTLIRNYTHLPIMDLKENITVKYHNQICLIRMMFQWIRFSNCSKWNREVMSDLDQWVCQGLICESFKKKNQFKRFIHLWIRLLLLTVCYFITCISSRLLIKQNNIKKHDNISHPNKTWRLTFLRCHISNTVFNTHGSNENKLINLYQISRCLFRY